MVSIIDDETIEERLVQDFADLVKYEPGVYVENNVTRLGLNGFNIRGIGGNRVLTQVDGVQTAEQFAFGPFSIHQAGLDVDALKSVEIVRSANSALYGSDAPRRRRVACSPRTRRTTLGGGASTSAPRPPGTAAPAR